MKKENLSKEELFEAVRQGTRDAILKILYDGFDFPGEEFLYSIEKGAKSAIENINIKIDLDTKVG